jgi:hypothetical protein
MSKIITFAAATLLAMSSTAFAADNNNAANKNSDTNKCADSSGMDANDINANCTTEQDNGNQ